MAEWLVDKGGRKQRYNAAQSAAGTDADPWAALAKAEESGVELPYEWQPDFWPLFSLAVVFALLALWYFGQVWSVGRAHRFNT
jgi:hypothetical protein